MQVNQDNVGMANRIKFALLCKNQSQTNAKDNREDQAISLNKCLIIVKNCITVYVCNYSIIRYQNKKKKDKLRKLVNVAASSSSSSFELD